MKHFKFICLIFLLGLAGQGSTESRIVSVEGDVKIRRGLEESWLIAAPDMLLEDIDSIMNGETGIVVLQMQDGRNFRMGQNSILDIADLRAISERELFLFLTAKKINSLKVPENQTPVRLQHVSTVRADQKTVADTQDARIQNIAWKREANAALAMVDQSYHPNAVVKIYKILGKYAAGVDRSRLYLYLGKAFEALDENGRALEAYQSALNFSDPSTDSSVTVESSEAILRLKQP